MSMNRISHIVVHYSATFADQDLGAADIDKMHRERKPDPFKMIGYHYVIRRDGRVEKGRPDTMVGAHVGGQNSGKLGICWIGGTERATGPKKGVDNRTPAQTDSLVRLIKELLAKHPGARVVGHRDLASTQCPGFDVIPWWSGVSRQAPAAAFPIPHLEGAPARTPDVVEGDLHEVAAGDTLSAIARDYGVTAEAVAAASGIALHGTLRVGQTLRIPAAEAAEPEDAKLDALLDRLDDAAAELRAHLRPPF